MPEAPATATAARGLVLGAAGYLLIACSDVAAKLALAEAGPALAVAWRGAVGALAIALLVRGRGLGPVNARLVLGRGLLHSVVSVAFYVSWVGMPLADSYAVAAVTPLLMTLFAIPMLGEVVGWRRWVASGVGFGGVVLMLQPGGDLWRWETPMLLAAMGLLAVSRIWTRILARTDTPAAVSFWLMLAHVPTGLLMALAAPPGHWVPGWGELPALVAMGALNGAAHLLFARAFALAPVSSLAPLEYSPLLWGVLFGALIWGDLPSGLTLAGAGVVVAAGLYNVRRERDRRRAALLDARATPP